MIKWLKNLFTKKKNKIQWDNEKKTTMWMFKNAEAALVFYERVIERKAKTMEEKEKILREMAEEGLMMQVVQTNRTPDQIKQDFARNYNNILDIRKSKEEE